MKFEFFDEKGEHQTTKHHPRHFPSTWLPEKVKTSPKKKKSAKTAANNLVFVFTTEERSPKQSKYIDDWTKVKIGDCFWLRSGARMEVHEKEEVDRGKWNYIFGTVNSYKKCGAIFLTLSDSDQKEFSEIPVEQQISYLNVPNKVCKNFLDERWGLEPLKKYCYQVANQERLRAEKRAEERRKEYAKWEQEAEKLQKLRAAEKDDTFGELSVTDSIYVRPGFRAEVKYIVSDEIGANHVLAAHFENFMDKTETSDWVPELASEKVRQPLKVDVIKPKMTGNDYRREFNLLKSLKNASKEGIIDKNLLPIIAAYYEWRYNNVLSVK